MADKEFENETKNLKKEFAVNLNKAKWSVLHLLEKNIASIIHSARINPPDDRDSLESFICQKIRDLALELFGKVESVALNIVEEIQDAIPTNTDFDGEFSDSSLPKSMKPIKPRSTTKEESFFDKLKRNTTEEIDSIKLSLKEFEMIKVIVKNEIWKGLTEGLFSKIDTVKKDILTGIASTFQKHAQFWNRYSQIEKAIESIFQDLKAKLTSAIKKFQNHVLDKMKTGDVVRLMQSVKKNKGWLIGIGAGIAAVAAAPVVLGAAGFTAGGVAAGSIAAGVQSAVYGGATTGVFSVLQSAGAVGLSASANAAIAATAGGAAKLVHDKVNKKED